MASKGSSKEKESLLQFAIFEKLREAGVDPEEAAERTLFTLAGIKDAQEKDKKSLELFHKFRSDKILNPTLEKRSIFQPRIDTKFLGGEERALDMGDPLEMASGIRGPKPPELSNTASVSQEATLRGALGRGALPNSIVEGDSDVSVEEFLKAISRR